MLRLLDEVSADGRAVTSDRAQALLATLVAAHGRAVGEETLSAAVWGADERPANAAKALQVVVSRTRTVAGADAVVRTEGGYRLGLPADAVDALVLAAGLRAAVRAEAAGDLVAAREAARAALAVPVADAATGPGALADLRAEARARRTTALGVLGRSASGLGEHAEALAALLAVLSAVPDPDESTLVAVLRSEAAVHGAPAALARYEQHRAEVRDRLGVDPGPELQAVHAALLAADNPVRTGLGFDATSLVGRDDDVRRLRALVRESRVTSIVGPGGLGKTRLARLLGREADQPVVHFVELVGVASGEDVVGEVGSALGIRDSVSGRRVLTPEQRADVRGRLAQQLDAAPTLLVLDNCEHVVDAVADLVAPLVATTRHLRVVTTTRAPLGIAAERVFALDQLDDDAAAELFGQRARAARPGVVLEPDAVRRVVARLDGLPLAIELAAAKVRAMSVDDIATRLDDRFALLRGADRGAADRHQTLLAVIDWSWNLLGEPERQALRVLSVFQDGFCLEAADDVLGLDAFGAVESLVGQSLLQVREDAGGLRYRMLETVREFGALQLAAAGESAPAAAAVRRWCVRFCTERLEALVGRDQVATVRAIGVEENNLADVLRECLADADGDAAAALLAVLGGFWMIRGEHARIVTLLGAFEDLLGSWQPDADDPRACDVAARAASVLVLNTAVAEIATPPRSRALLARLGPASTDPATRALDVALLRLEAVRHGGDSAALESLVGDPDRHIAMLALQWQSHYLENEGDPDQAVVLGERAIALWRPEDGVWSKALLDTHLAGFHHQRGRLDLARRYAQDGLAVLDALEAHDDAIQLRAILVSAALGEGDVPAAERLLAEMSRVASRGLWGGTIVLGAARAEVALARGDVAEGLALYDRALDEVRDIRFPGMQLEVGLEPWTLYIESISLAAHAWHGTAAAADRLRDIVAPKLVAVLAGDRIDYPVAGCLFYGLGIWQLRRRADPVGALGLALADRFGYNRFSAAVSWERATSLADDIAPGALDAHLASYTGRRGAALLDEARALAPRLL